MRRASQKAPSRSVVVSVWGREGRDAGRQEGRSHLQPPTGGSRSGVGGTSSGRALPSPYHSGAGEMGVTGGWGPADLGEDQENQLAGSVVYRFARFPLEFGLMLTAGEAGFLFMVEDRNIVARLMSSRAEVTQRKFFPLMLVR